MMEPVQSYEEIEKEIDRLKAGLSSRNYDMYELDLLSRTAVRAGGFCPDCGVCQNSLEAISRILKDAADPSRMKGAVLNNYSNTFKRVVRHLEESHGIIRRGVIIRSLLKGMLLGVLPGLVASPIGLAMKDDIIVAIGFGTLFLGLLLGIWFGLRTGRHRSAEAETENRFL